LLLRPGPGRFTVVDDSERSETERQEGVEAQWRILRTGEPSLAGTIDAVLNHRDSVACVPNRRLRRTQRIVGVGRNSQREALPELLFHVDTRLTCTGRKPAQVGGPSTAHM
jgi:hypothetical protein